MNTKEVITTKDSSEQYLKGRVLNRRDIEKIRNTFGTPQIDTLNAKGSRDSAVIFSLLLIGIIFISFCFYIYFKTSNAEQFYAQSSIVSKDQNGVNNREQLYSLIIFGKRQHEIVLGRSKIKEGDKIFFPSIELETIPYDNYLPNNVGKTESKVRKIISSNRKFYFSIEIPKISQTNSSKKIVLIDSDKWQFAPTKNPRSFIANPI